MISEEEIEKIRIYLKKSENPLFFYDDDPDGLTSFLLLSKYIEKGKGIPVKSSPNMDSLYLRKIDEYSPDYIFILDKPFISQDMVNKINVPVIWIDHHPLVDIKGINYFNPRKQNPEDSRPTSYWCYKVVRQNLWIAMCGIVGDWHAPEEEVDALIKEYPDLLKKTTSPGEILFTTDFGRLIKIFAFLLKGSTSNIKNNISILAKIENPYEILQQTTSKGNYLYKYYLKINKEYEALINKARSSATSKNILIFTYPTKSHSLTGYLANELLFNYPDKIIIIGREKNDMTLMSFRSSSIPLPELLQKALNGLEGYNGGHTHACGGGIKKEQFHQFISNIKKELKNQCPKNN
ncbi:MAG: DHH family phosphoesterase [Nanoarchaeota archaeon]|nr:DHH family phosphoesterase [Nanoarchaeota archaeon]